MKLPSAAKSMPRRHGEGAGGAAHCLKIRAAPGLGYCVQKCTHLFLTGTGAHLHHGDMNGREFIARVRKWARSRDLEVRFVASEGAGSHGTLYAGNRKTTVKDRKKEIGKSLLNKMIADLGIERSDF